MSALLLKRLAYYNIEFLAIEATGRYEWALTEAAFDKGIPVCILKPLSVRRTVACYVYFSLFLNLYL
jgi:hypothetical protein